MLGTRAGIVEMVKSPVWLRRITVVLWLGGGLAFAYAAWLTGLLIVDG